MLVLGGLLVVGILLQVRYGLSPLRKLAEAVADVSSGRARGLDQPQAEELRPLVGQINRLLEQNQARLAETRLQFANMAHGLKTPVASLYLALNDNADPTGEARRQVDRIDRQIKHHLGRARAGVSAAGLAPATMLRPCVDDIVTMMQKLYVDRDLLITSDVESTVSVACAPQDVDEIMGAMIDNAFKWAKSSVRIVGRADGGEIAIVIEDDGPGIKSDNITEVMNPGVRLDETVPGDGFGLSIAREVCELYGGRVTLMNLPEGGLSATVVLPTTPG
jgi:signal transduction histidine kinase